MPPFELETLDGARFSSTALAGKVALVDFWATWCQPCLDEIPFWNQLHQRHAHLGFTVLGIVVQSGWASDVRSDIEKPSSKSNTR
jgi:thiol-disulfide isomerase/thioredoxin